jgi:hypothetical protein
MKGFGGGVESSRDISRSLGCGEQRDRILARHPGGGSWWVQWVQVGFMPIPRTQLAPDKGGVRVREWGNR